MSLFRHLILENLHNGTWKCDVCKQIAPLNELILKSCEKDDDKDERQFHTLEE